MQNKFNQKKSNPKVRLIAFYLPQYYPIPENDKWWGNGFTEWTNVAKARPLFHNHYQPHIPADLGFYDLRVPETREAQAELAKNHGIEGFCYYHYWFNGKRLLERVFNEVLTSKKPQFPFCLAWANQTWTGIWHGSPDRILMEQTYPGIEDHIKHFNFLIEAFTDDRYIKIDGKPLFVVYRPTELPDSRRVTDLWRELAVKAGLKGLYLIGEAYRNWVPQENGFDAAINRPLTGLNRTFSWRQPDQRLILLYHRIRRLPVIYTYEEFLKICSLKIQRNPENIPCLIPNWDNTPRSGSNGLVLHQSNPELFRAHVKQEFGKVLPIKQRENRIVFIKSWNEWAEGNYLEPDSKFGHAYLKAIQEELYLEKR